MKKLCSLLLIIMLIFSFIGCSQKLKKTEIINKAAIEITDSEGKVIKMDKPAERIISLYSAHTENLFSLGLDKEIIGIGTSDVYPPEAINKKIFDYKADPENIIAQKPDMVLIRPFIKKSAPDFVKSLENAGIKVVSLYPEKYDDFEGYILKLGILTGKSEKAKELLGDFKKDIDEIKIKTNAIEPKTKVFFESTDVECRTITKDSMAAKAISFAGGINIAEDAKPQSEGSSIASYGFERVVEKGDKIDVYISQVGAMNAGGTIDSISKRPGFSTVKAVKEGRIYNIDEKLVSSPTFRYEKGVMEIARMLYPNVFDDLSIYKNNTILTRSMLAEIAVKYKHKTIFTPSTGYYKKQKKGHIYGGFKDVGVNSKNFDYIETAVLSGYMNIDSENFEPQKKVTRQELAETIFMIKDMDKGDKSLEIKDIDKVSKKDIVQKVVDNRIMKLDSNNLFNPENIVKCSEAIEYLDMKVK